MNNTPLSLLGFARCLSVFALRFERVQTISNLGCAFVLLRIDRVIQLLDQTSALKLAVDGLSGSLGGFPDMVSCAALRAFNQRPERRVEDLVTVRATQHALLAKLIERHTAVAAHPSRAFGLALLSRLRLTRFVRHDKLREQLINRLLTGHIDTGLRGMIFTQMHFLLDAVSNGHFVHNCRFVAIVALHHGMFTNPATSYARSARAASSAADTADKPDESTQTAVGSPLAASTTERMAASSASSVRIFDNGCMVLASDIA